MAETAAQPGALVPIEREALARAHAAAPDDAILSGVVAIFRALADPTRTRILYALANAPLCGRDLAILVGVSESAISPTAAANAHPRHHGGNHERPLPGLVINGTQIEQRRLALSSQVESEGTKTAIPSIVATNGALL